MSKIADLLIEKSEIATEQTLVALSIMYNFNDYEDFKYRLSEIALELVTDDQELNFIDMFVENDNLVLDYDGSIIGKIINKEVF